MTGFLIIVVLLGLGFWHASRKDAARTRQAKLAAVARKLDAELRVARQAKIKGDLIDFAIAHERTLRSKQRQLTITDAYGTTDESQLVKELEYFFRKVTPSSIRLEFEETYGESSVDVAALVLLLWLHEDAPSFSETALAYEADMTGLEFERLVAERLGNAGADVRFTSATGDQGADLVVSYDGAIIVIQCKRSASTIGNKAVQEAFAGCKFYDADQAWVVSDAPFSRQARQLASSLNVRLVDFDQVEGAL